MSDHDEKPAFGPSGYLPERASKRARKIVLRAPLGIQWVIGSAVAGLVVVIAGVWFLVQSGDPPPAPWEPIAEVGELDGSQVTTVGGNDLLVVATGGRVRAFADAQDVAYCAASNRLEAADGSIWSLTGRGVNSTDSLDEYPTMLHDGVAYVDPTALSDGPSPSDTEVEPGCH